MTESFRRDGEYEQYDTPYQGAQQQHASSPVNPEWPPPPAQPPAAPAQPAAPVQKPVVEPTTVWPGGQQAQPAAFASGGAGSYGGDGNGGGGAPPPPPPGPAPAPPPPPPR